MYCGRAVPGISPCDPGGYQEDRPKILSAALTLSAAVAAFIGIAAVIDFNAVFVRFHHIFFDNDQWIFDPATDYMIRMLPEGLFYDFVIRIGGIFLGILGILFVASLITGISA